MNYYTKQIMSILDCNQAFARLVQDHMECSAFDFSEATETEFKQEVQYAMFEVSTAA
jgi:hypothetical protein